ncbi:MAG: hypothetical protein O3A84_13635 [Proteobacteria bacterium]|nr:hypothetical protein [Pseudomonadota bacterium]
MELSEYLKKGGTEKINIIAISWTEGRYGDANEGRLQRFVKDFHPAIRVIRSTDKIDKAFSPLVYVPANFVFDKNGKRAHGNGSRNPMSGEELDRILASMK